MAHEADDDMRGYMHKDNDLEENIGTYFSRWVDLKEGEHYYYEAWYQSLGQGHMTVGVEVEPTSGVHNYNRVSRQWMDLKIDSDADVTGSF